MAKPACGSLCLGQESLDKISAVFAVIIFLNAGKQGSPERGKELRCSYEISRVLVLKTRDDSLLFCYGDETWSAFNNRKVR